MWAEIAACRLEGVIAGCGTRRRLLPGWASPRGCPRPSQRPALNSSLWVYVQQKEGSRQAAGKVRTGRHGGKVPHPGEPSGSMNLEPTCTPSGGPGVELTLPGLPRWNSELGTGPWLPPGLGRAGSLEPSPEASGAICGLNTLPQAVLPGSGEEGAVALHGSMQTRRC